MLEAATAVCASASLLQGASGARAAADCWCALSGFRSDAQRSVQFVRLTLGVHVALVGMKSEHVRKISRRRRRRRALESILKLFRKAEL